MHARKGQGFSSRSGQALQKAPMFRQTMASEWTAAAFGIFIVGLHLAWFLASARQSEVLSGLGGSVTVLGILVAAQPYIRKGVRQAGREQAGLEEARGDRQHPDAESKEAEAAGVRHVLKERVIGVALIGAGSVLNAYGPAIASILKLRGS